MTQSTAPAATIADRRAELFASTSTEALLGALVILDAASTMSADERRVYVWTCDEIERRHPEVDAYLDAAFENEHESRTYGELLAAALGC